jgi:glucuronoarabinoxylan endo-1,4-beta-xylanase
MNNKTIRNKSLYFMMTIALMIVSCSKKDSSNGQSDTAPNAAVIDLADSQQIIRGFGGMNYLPQRPDMTADQVKKAFGTDSGQIGLSILRLRVPFQESEFGLNVATSKLASSMGVTIIASPWTPPAWMKTNKNIVGGRLNDTSYASYAAHLKSFTDYMASNGIPLYAISVQNEPDISVSYESCSWNASEMLAFVKNNAPAIGTKIIVPESFNFDHTISDAVLNDSIAASHVSIIGGHIYGEGFKGFLWSLYQSIIAGGHVLNGGLTSYPLAANKGKEVWMTEHLNTDTSWSAVIGTAREIHDCMNAGMGAYIWWYIVRFYGPILEDGNISKRGYIMSQYARFIRPGYARVHATANPQSDVYVTAYKNSSKVTIVAINSNGSSIRQTFTIRNGTVSRFIPCVTSSTKNCIQGNAVSVSNGSFTATLEPSSVTTFVSN